MSRTRRIYNKLKVKKTPRYNLDDDELHIPIGIPYTRRSWICMGKCPQCRDPDKEPKAIRRKLKEEIRTELSRELKILRI